MSIKTTFAAGFLLLFFSLAAFGQVKDRVGKIVIDAGHGGTMPGAVGKLCKEKDINLKVALRLGKLISENFDDVTVIYTRKGDETVDLYKRAEMANKNKGDLFISIHCNAAENKSAHGVETFVIGLGKTEESMAIAKKENADMLLEKDYKTNYSDFNPNSAEAYVVFSLYSSAYRNNSINLASKVQTHLVSNTKMNDRTVQEAGFWVLYKVAMPSILIELGFISHAEEEQYLIRDDTQELLAVSIYNALVEYKNLVEGTLKPFLPIPKISKNKSAPTIDTPEIIGVSESTQNIQKSNIEIVTDSFPTQLMPVNSNTKENIRFRIQFFTCKENLKTSDKKFSELSEVSNYFENNLWKYTTGNFKALNEAQTALKEVKKRYADAFIIAFQNERKITVQEAQKLLE